MCLTKENDMSHAFGQAIAGYVSALLAVASIGALIDVLTPPAEAPATTIFIAEIA